MVDEGKEAVRLGGGDELRGDLIDPAVKVMQGDLGDRPAGVVGLALNGHFEIWLRTALRRGDVYVGRIED